MVLTRPGLALQPCVRPDPQPADNQILIKVHACGVCRTDLHIVDGELTGGTRPIVPGHEIVGTIIERGKTADRWPVGTRVGVPWLAAVCGHCSFCRNGQENLCDQARYTGYDIDGGYADMVLADPDFCVQIPNNYSDANAAPLSGRATPRPPARSRSTPRSFLHPSVNSSRWRCARCARAASWSAPACT